MYRLLFAPRRRAAALLSAASVLAALFLLCPQAAREGALEGLLLCRNSLVPALFPFLVACDLALAALAEGFPRLPAAVKLAAAWLAGQVGGFVAGAKALCALAAQGVCSSRTAALLLCGSVNAGPAFLLSAVGIGLFADARAGVCLFLALLFASLCCTAAALPLRGAPVPAPGAKTPEPPPASLPDSVARSVTATANLCGCAVLFSCLRRVCFSLLPQLREKTRFLLSALFEVTCGCSEAAQISDGSGLYLTAAAVSLCGISVIAQLQLFCRPTGVSLLPFLLSRALHLPLSLVFLRLLLAALPADAAALRAVGGEPALPFCASPSASLALFCLCACALAGRGRDPPLYSQRKNGV